MKYFAIAYLLALMSCKTINTVSNRNNAIDVWYGKSQQIGKLYVPQRWVNVLGNNDTKVE